MQESQKALRDFKLKKMVTLIQSLMGRRNRQLRTWGIDAIQLYSMDLAHKQTKVRKHLSFTKANKCFRAWLNVIKIKIQER